MDKIDLEKDAPFYSWNCITLSIRHKWDVYLIIKNESVMTKFIKLLIHNTETLDGIRGSAIPFKKTCLIKKKNILKVKDLTKANI